MVDLSIPLTGESKAGKDEAGSPRSYASMTYAGLLSFIYVNVDKNDDRVKSAVQWIAKHFTVEENYGMGAQGSLLQLSHDGESVAPIRKKNPY